MTKYKLILLLLVLFGLNAAACRFTVREIGFSILSQDIYTLAVIDTQANPNDQYWQSFHQQNKDCNIRLEVLHPEKDSEHPVVMAAKEKGLSFPVTVLVSPDRRMFVFKDNNSKTIHSRVKESFLREQMRKQYPGFFAVVLWVPGKNEDKNLAFAKKVQDECGAIENIMPSMPKLVKQGPVSLKVSVDDFEKENVLLWSLGIEMQANEPKAFVLYGRGRIMGEALNYQQVMEGGLYKYMSMIGADCECGLDRKWMLGHQIPLYWPADTRQHLTKLLGFDVDNPMILAEMSRILAKEKLSNASGSVAFAPETIDLEEVFGSGTSEEKTEEFVQEKNKSTKSLIFTLLGIGVLVISGASIVLLKKK